jgi:hypothetical protein
MRSEYRLIPAGDTDVVAEGKCIQTGKIYRTAPFNELNWQRWRYLRVMIQEALPELDMHDREFLMSGFSPEGWTEFYGTDDE